MNTYSTVHMVHTVNNNAVGTGLHLGEFENKIFLTVRLIQVPPVVLSGAVGQPLAYAI